MSHFVERMRAEPLSAVSVISPAASRPTMLELYLSGRGSRWVAGRLTRTGHHLTFGPRRRRMVVRMSLDLHDVTLVDVVPGLLVSTVTVRTSTHLLHLRARAAWIQAFVDQLAGQVTRAEHVASTRRPVVAMPDRRAG